MNLWWLGGIVLALLILTLWAFNSLVSLRTRAEAAFSDIDTQLKKRHDLIPDLVATAKGYMTHEKEVFTKVAELRTAAMNTNSIHEKEEIEHNISSALSNFFILAEQYPDLKAAPQFASLQASLAAVEDSISRARRYYNAVVRDYNSLQASFPVSMMTGLGHLTPMPFFSMEESERSNTSLSF